MTFEELKAKVEQWSAIRNLNHKENARSQFLKFTEESGELAKSILKNTDCTDDFGDVLVTLIILADQLNYDLVKCLEAAYEEIKDREGKTINGSFIR